MQTELLLVSPLPSFIQGPKFLGVDLMNLGWLEAAESVEPLTPSRDCPCWPFAVTESLDVGSLPHKTCIPAAAGELRSAHTCLGSRANMARAAQRM
mmetsp:Transcript_102484/g.295050  ORF Transcript_102484/g.295050 Transcript_102484/m.295050 type:complete len:96 (-) Transcript_102484:37-324(-)